MSIQGTNVKCQGIYIYIYIYIFLNWLASPYFAGNIQGYDANSDCQTNKWQHEVTDNQIRISKFLTEHHQVIWNYDSHIQVILAKEYQHQWTCSVCVKQSFSLGVKLVKKVSKLLTTDQVVLRLYFRFTLRLYFRSVFPSLITVKESKPGDDLQNV